MLKKKLYMGALFHMILAAFIYNLAQGSPNPGLWPIGNRLRPVCRAGKLGTADLAKALIVM